MVKVPELRRALRGLKAGEILIPALQTTLHDPSYGDIDIHIPAFERREPDGYFHPSTHSSWNVRQLALYLMAPQLMANEPMPYTGTLAITQGHFWHAFIQQVLTEAGLLLGDEIAFTDEVFRRRGHMDGLLEGEGLEIKSMNSRTITKMVDEDALRTLKFEYWCQAQEYLDVFNLPRMRFLFFTPDYPFPMKEFVVQANPEHQTARRATYAKAIEIAETGKLPLSKFSVPCCGRPDICATVKGCQYGG